MRLLLSLGLFALCHAAIALDFERMQHDGKQFTTCHVDLRVDKLQLFLQGQDGSYLKSFSAIDEPLKAHGMRLLFGMNAGMYQPGFAPVGWFVQHGKEITPITLANGEGNFFLKPNGVFLVSSKGAMVLETSRAAAFQGKVELATQSGPLLVEQGKIHPAFQPQSQSLLFRNGVGVADASDVYFAISEEPVNFYQFATLFRDALHCPDALFLDGTISSLHAPALNRSDKKIDLGPIIGIVGPFQKSQP